MKNLILLLLLSTQQTFAFDFALTCDSKGQATKFNLPAKFDSAVKQDVANDWIWLADPIAGTYSNRAGRYKESLLRDVIHDALAVNVDPYMALAVVAVENPLDGSDRSEGYVRSWGRTPVDGPGSAAAVGCVGTKDQLRNRSTQLEVFRASDSGGRRELFSLGGGMITSSFGPIQDDKERTEVEAALASGNISNGCYFWAEGLNADWLGSSDDVENEKLYVTERDSLHSQMGSKYMAIRWSEVRHLMAAHKGVWENTDTWRKFSGSSYYQLAVVMQGYNGYGVYGKTESVDNNCLQGLNTARDPIYGAGVMDLALNMFLGNSQIREIVQQEMTKLNQSATPSELCATWGAGTHAINTGEFSNIQQRIMQGRGAGACSATHAHK